MTAREWVLGISGASGTKLALRFVEKIVARREVEALHVVVSANALLVARTELDGPLKSASALLARAELSAAARRKLRLHAEDAIAAPISSGSYPVGGMAIVPCSASTLGAIASGATRGLLQRAADVNLKERRPLVIALRETPLSLIHAENIVAVTRAGAIVAPPLPPYYLKDASPDDWLDHTVMRYLDLLGFPSQPSDLRWGRC